MDKAKRLIAAGYLPKELTPEFTAVPLSRTYKKVVAAFSKPSAPWSAPALFSLARGGHARRTLKLPNPVNYIRQATIIDRHWKAIRSVCVPDRLSLTTPLFRAPRKGRNRATNVGPVQDLPRRRLAALAANRYVLQTDFAQYYRSIYTHAIPWGILGKKKAKSNFAKGIKTFADDLDRSVREGQEGQTMGIPVGPDISHILSEVIAARVDRTAFRSGVPEGFRHADDYFLCFKTESEAGRALDRLADAARSFELDLNYDKTSIAQIRELTDSIGLDPLSDFFPSSTGSVSEKELHHFFALATKLSRTEENALSYALRILAQKSVDPSVWRVLESYLLRSATINPNCIDMVGFMLYRHSLLGAALSQDRISAYFCGVLVNAIAFNLDTEALWALWIFKVLRYRVPRAATSAVSKSTNSFVALVALDLRDAGLLSGTLDASYWSSLLTPGNLYSDSWLLVYESIVKGWLAPSGAFVSSDPFFGPMQSDGVVFYQPGRTADIAAQLGPRPYATSAPEINVGPIQFFLLETSRLDVASVPDLTINLDEIEDDYETDEFDEGEDVSEYDLY